MSPQVRRRGCFGKGSGLMYLVSNSRELIESIYTEKVALRWIVAPQFDGLEQQFL